jgi:hypothetical protein
MAVLEDNCFDKDVGLPVAPVRLLDHSRSTNIARRADVFARSVPWVRTIDWELVD